MTEQTIRNKYFELLQAHVARPAEEHLTAIAELGRALVLADVPPEEIAEIHEEALQRLAQERPDVTLLDTARLLSAPLMEMLMAYGLAFRERNARLQREIAEHKRAEEELRQRQLQLSVLNRLGVALAETLELERVYRIAFKHVAQLVDCPCFGISLYDPTTRTLRAEFMLDDGELIDAARFPPLVMDAEPTRGRVRAIATRQPEIIADYPTITEEADILVVGASGDNRPVGSAMYVPMVVRGQVTGLLEMQSHRVNAYGAEETALLGPVANQIGLAIENARLYEQARQEIAERERAEEALKEYSERLEEMVDERTQELRDAQEQLVRQEKLAVLGLLAGAMAHELRNPLGAISNAAYFLNMVTEEPEPEVKEMLEIMEKEVRTSERIISSLLDFARPQPPIRRIVDVNEVIRETLSRAAVPDNVEVVRQLEEPLPTVLADPDQLVQAFGNLILNAIQAMTLPTAAGMPEGGRLVVKTQGRGDPCGRPEWVTVSITDTGEGISEENMGKLFQPLFTTKAKGIGLGLALAKTLAEANGGSIEVESEVGKGSTFTVRLQSI